MTETATPPRLLAAQAASVELYPQGQKRALVMLLMGERLAQGRGPVRAKDLLQTILRDHPEVWADVEPPTWMRQMKKLDGVLLHLTRDGYLIRYRQNHAKGGVPLATVWDLGPATLGALS